ncbi:hypothetical protein GH733_009190 [Mirounga leonina]|nr:hypothetical protein GH733_009190 [Mirounga leonina]
MPRYLKTKQVPPRPNLAPSWKFESSTASALVSLQGSDSDLTVSIPSCDIFQITDSAAFPVLSENFSLIAIAR